MNFHRHWSWIVDCLLVFSVLMWRSSWNGIATSSRCFALWFFCLLLDGFFIWFIIEVKIVFFNLTRMVKFEYEYNCFTMESFFIFSPLFNGFVFALQLRWKPPWMVNFVYKYNGYMVLAAPWDKSLLETPSIPPKVEVRLSYTLLSLDHKWDYTRYVLVVLYSFTCQCF